MPSQFWQKVIGNLTILETQDLIQTHTTNTLLQISFHTHHSPQHHHFIQNSHHLPLQHPYTSNVRNLIHNLDYTIMLVPKRTTFIAKKLLQLSKFSSTTIETSSTATLNDNTTVTFRTGKIARLASGAITSQIGDSVVLATAVSDPYMTDKGFMPMTVDFRTKPGAMGLIPGNLFRKEMGQADNEILSARVIDRTLRPLFPDGYHHESQIITTLQSFDPLHSDIDVQSINAASMALCVSDIPFHGPVAAVRIALSKVEKWGKSKWRINPTSEFLNSDECSGHLLYAGIDSRPIMLEGEMLEWSEADITTAMEMAHQEIQPLLTAQIELTNKIGKPKREFQACVPSLEMNSMAQELGLERAMQVVNEANGASKSERGQLQTVFYSWMKKELTVKMKELDENYQDENGV